MIRTFISIILLSAIFAIDYNSQIQPIFNSNCTNCHQYGSGSYGSHQLDLTSYSGLMSGAASGEVIIPGNSGSSILFQEISSGSMPPSSSDLSADEIALVEQWIDEGALEFENNEHHHINPQGH